MSITRSPSGLWRIGTAKPLFKSKAEAEKFFALFRKKRLLDSDGQVIAGKEGKYREELHGYFHEKKAAPKNKP